MAEEAGGVVGTMRLHLIEAKLTHDTQKIGKMDPYVIVKIREEDWTGPIHDNGGKHPNWENLDNTKDFKIKYLGDEIFFHVYDEEVFKDSDVCEGQAKLSALCCDGGMDEWYALTHKGKDAGRIHIKAEWFPVA